jgi:transcriptional regulator with XRE-family HTH domain
MKIHLAVLEARQSSNLSQIQLGKLTGLSPAYISKVENSCLVPTLETLVRVAGGLNLTAGQLLDRALDPSLDENSVRRREITMGDGSKRVIPIKQRVDAKPRTLSFPRGNLVHDRTSIESRRALGKLICGSERKSA